MKTTEINDRKELLKYLTRYYAGKSLTIQVVRHNDPLDCSDSEDEIFLDDFSFHVYILKLGLRYEYKLVKAIETDEKLFKKLRKKLRMQDKDCSEFLPITEFLNVNA